VASLTFGGLHLVVTHLDVYCTSITGSVLTCVPWRSQAQIMMLNVALQVANICPKLPSDLLCSQGLDSTTAMHLLQLLRQLSQGGRAIVTTIHQPSSRLYQQLDKLLLLSQVCFPLTCTEYGCNHALECKDNQCFGIIRYQGSPLIYILCVWLTFPFIACLIMTLLDVHMSSLFSL